jgi:hypothetical protein
MPAFQFLAGKVIHHESISPKRTGGERGLYGFTGVCPELSNVLALDFFIPIVDRTGHAALAKIIQDGPETLTDRAFGLGHLLDGRDYAHC